MHRALARTFASCQTCRFHVSGFASRYAQPVLADEFEKHLQPCLPPKHLAENTAVAFSGGPDSTCLLYLLKELANKNSTNGLWPRSVIALTVDHGLQAASHAMTEKCIAIAASLEVKHLVLKIPWGIPPFPQIPSTKSSFENLAREARYHLLLSALRQEGASTIAFGHHADDQVETALLRISRGSTEFGVAGMRTRRLWGMGFGSGPTSLGWAGQHGMNRWIIRPLLHLPKERLVATCQAADLPYVVDKTNFQPGVALRNRIRYMLTDENSKSIARRTEAIMGMTARVGASGNGTREAHDTHQEDGPTSLPQLRSAVESISEFVDKLHLEASIQLAKCMRPSPTSTIFLSKDAFSCVTDNSVRLEMIRRVLRYVSPCPWGSPRAEAGRRTASLQLVSDNIDSPKGRLAKQGSTLIPKKFTAGGAVMWSPVYHTRDSGMTSPEKGKTFFNETGWLASRQPPIRRYGDTTSKSLELDITLSVVSALSQGRSLEILYDCRFVLHIRPHLFEPDVLNVIKQIADSIVEGKASVRLLVVPHTRYFLPKVVLRRTDAQAKLRIDGVCKSQVHETERGHERESEIARLSPDGSTRTQSAMGENNKDGTHPAQDLEAVRIKYIRILDADTSYEHLGLPSM